MAYSGLPPFSRCHFIYVGEGAANIVFKILVHPGVDNGDGRYSAFQGLSFLS